MHVALPGLGVIRAVVLGLEVSDAAVTAHNRCLAAEGMRRVSAARCVIKVLCVQNCLKYVCTDVFTCKTSRFAFGSFQGRGNVCWLCAS